MSEVEEKVADIIVGILEVEREKITPAARFQEDLDANSLAVVGIVMSAEDAFDIHIPDETADILRTVGELIAFIETTQRA